MIERRAGRDCRSFPSPSPSRPSPPRATPPRRRARRRTGEPRARLDDVRPDHPPARHRPRAEASRHVPLVLPRHHKNHLLSRLCALSVVVVVVVEANPKKDEARCARGLFPVLPRIVCVALFCTGSVAVLPARLPLSLSSGAIMMGGRARGDEGRPPSTAAARPPLGARLLSGLSGVRERRRGRAGTRGRRSTSL